ncbi:hypothetical protein DDB_G0286945 [Dictyostelium discoideum AX4]|uniref:Uncharacterized protein n=1 Tax=Dictyostelium discoideum TaxID=44689 RepID=Q54L24_DICDI|nr:hypothetical protein DDB_G0286945 [Dictyostelium discoideum AX4]EAL63970.1 hypothetical protein DDB_G0286945 [Dictyostelium discoideum AX4]|eukprot:XP_637479.1 hypothetical protein DDB_G0286945 [Dictyostelium discoideum AX4]
MKKDIILVLLIVLHLFFFVSIFAISPNSEIKPQTIDTQSSTLTTSSTTTTTTSSPTTTPLDIKQQQLKQNIIDSNNNNKIKEEEKEKSKNVYVTFADNAEYLKGIVALRMSMINTKCNYGLIVFVTKQVEQQDREPLQLLDCDVREIEMVDIPKEVSVQIDRWRPAFTKFRAWQLVEYERVIWLDSDMLLLKSLDHLFDLVDIGNPKLLYAAIDADANSCVFNSDRLKLINSGIMLLSPSIDVYNLLIDGMVVVSKLPNQSTVNDQDVINTTLPHWRSLSYPEYGVQITHCECTSEPRLWNFTNTYFLHFTAGLKELPKPWSLLKKSQNEAKDIFKQMPTCIEQIYLNWINTYKEALDFIENKLNLVNLVK